MQWRDRLRLGLRTLLFHRRESERLRAEMQLHLDGLTAENIAAGMSPDDARHAAMRAFGNATVVGEQTQAHGAGHGWSDWYRTSALPCDRSGARRALR